MEGSGQRLFLFLSLRILIVWFSHVTNEHYCFSPTVAYPRNSLSLSVSLPCFLASLGSGSYLLWLCLCQSLGKGQSSYLVYRWTQDSRSSWIIHLNWSVLSYEALSSTYLWFQSATHPGELLLWLAFNLCVILIYTGCLFLGFTANKNDAFPQKSLQHFAGRFEVHLFPYVNVLCKIL